MKHYVKIAPLWNIATSYFLMSSNRNNNMTVARTYEAAATVARVKFWLRIMVGKRTSKSVRIS
jgi:hypothetical protein